VKERASDQWGGRAARRSLPSRKGVNFRNENGKAVVSFHIRPEKKKKVISAVGGIEVKTQGKS